MSDVHQWAVARLENDRNFFFFYQPTDHIPISGWWIRKHTNILFWPRCLYTFILHVFSTSVIHLYWCKRQNSCFLKMYTAGSECFAFVLKSYIGSIQLHVHVDHILTVRLIVPFSLVSQPLRLTLTLDNRPGDFVWVCHYLGGSQVPVCL